MKPSRSDCLVIHSFLPVSFANGPGARAVVWTQGCSLACPGCFNPETHAFSAGERLSIDRLFNRIADQGDQIEGVTLTGGEPLQQPGPVLALLSRLRLETSLSTLLFTGYTLDEIETRGWGDAIRRSVDVLIAGRYDAAQPDSGGYLSPGKSLHCFSTRYSEVEVRSSPTAEVIVTPEGELLLTGTTPLRWQSHP